MSRRGEEELSRTLGTRIVGVLGFNKAVFRDIYEDDFSDFQAQQMVLMAAISIMIGLIVAGPTFAFIGAIVIGLRWLVISEMIARQGVEEYPNRAEDFTRKRAMRIVGYSSGPLLLTFFFAIPIVGPITWVVLNAWSLTAIAVGARVILGDPPMSKIAVMLAIGGIPQLALLIGALIALP
jgi:hypothetical protein